MSSIEKYIKQVRRYLQVDHKTKTRITEGLMAEFEYALSNGETEDDFLKRIGSPKKVASDYNISYKEDPEYQKKRKYTIAKSASIISLVLTVVIIGVAVGLQVHTMKNSSVSQIGGVTEPVNVEITSMPITFFDLIKNVKEFIVIPLVVFVLSAAYCIIAKIKQKKVKHYEKD